METEWPIPVATALQLAVDSILTSYAPVGIVAAGSILRGEGGPTSDIDLYVIHLDPFRQRLQRKYAGVPVEIFVNPPQQVRRYFSEEHRSARPITAHILSTGQVLIDRDPVVQILRDEAAMWLAMPPDPTPDALRWRRYLLVDLLDDVRDVIDVDPVQARLLLGQIVAELADYRMLAANRHLAKPKQRLAALAELDPWAAALARQTIVAGDAQTALDLANRMARHAAGETSFFEWDGSPETVESG